MTAPVGRGVKRYWGASLVVAWLTAWTVVFGGGWIVNELLADRDATASSGIFALTAIFGLPVSLFICLVLGVPALAFAQKLKLTKWWQAALTGAGAGLLFALGLAAFSSPWGNLHLDTKSALNASIFIFAGAAAGVAAWASLALDSRSTRGS